MASAEGLSRYVHDELLCSSFQHNDSLQAYGLEVAQAPQSLTKGNGQALFDASDCKGKCAWYGASIVAWHHCCVRLLSNFHTAQGVSRDMLASMSALSSGST